ncbi:MAG: hypothetical protein NZ523_13515, partial [Elioraea sp.]|nr:hypothetical protein [Elioraea sp.]
MGLLRRLFGKDAAGHRFPEPPAPRPRGFAEAPAGLAAPSDGTASPAPSPEAAWPRAPAEVQFPSTGPHGHRARLRDKLLSRGADALADYELLEML